MADVTRVVRAAAVGAAWSLSARAAANAPASTERMEAGGGAPDGVRGSGSCSDSARRRGVDNRAMTPKEHPDEAGADVPGAFLDEAIRPLRLIAAGHLPGLSASTWVRLSHGHGGCQAFVSRVSFSATAPSEAGGADSSPTCPCQPQTRGLAEVDRADSSDSSIQLSRTWILS